MYVLLWLLPVTTLGILVMKLFTVLMGTPSVSSWMLVMMSSICGGDKVKMTKITLQAFTQSVKQNCVVFNTFSACDFKIRLVLDSTEMSCLHENM